MARRRAPLTNTPDNPTSEKRRARCHNYGTDFRGVVYARVIDDWLGSRLGRDSPARISRTLRSVGFDLADLHTATASAGLGVGSAERRVRVGRCRFPDTDRRARPPGGSLGRLPSAPIPGNSTPTATCDRRRLERVVFVNADEVDHDMSSDQHPSHLDCPAINQALDIFDPAKSRETGNFVRTDTFAGLHDHLNAQFDRWSTLTPRQNHRGRVVRSYLHEECPRLPFLSAQRRGERSTLASVGPRGRANRQAAALAHGMLSTST